MRVRFMVQGFLIDVVSPYRQTLRRYFDVTLVTAQLAPTAISKFNTGVQLLLVAATLAAAAADQLSSPVLPFLWSVLLQRPRSTEPQS